MADETNRNDDDLTPENNTPEQPEANITDSPRAPEPASDAAEESETNDAMQKRLQRLGGEPAPAISPEEFARLQQAGQIHIDSRGRVRTTRREETDAGMSLRKRRAWYAR
ncbi:MAG: hypothetical protein JXN59_17925 [Anaerolineae bacterium]|nr:hypothetical protein [Anaerolineae bacterium]